MSDSLCEDEKEKKSTIANCRSCVWRK